MPATWNGGQFKQTVKTNAVRHLKRMAIFVEGEAKMLCPFYTGLLRSSIHWKINEMKMYALVGVDENSMMATAVERLSKYRSSAKLTARRKRLISTVSGSNVFYAPYQEKGWTDRAGVFHKGRHFLQGGLDRLRQKKGQV
jgi:hypothetical protein